MEQAKLTVGGKVVFVDPVAVAHDALITAIWGDPNATPAINIVYVSDDEKRTDQYGRQTVHYTSVVHESMQSAHGNFWRHAA